MDAYRIAWHWAKLPFQFDINICITYFIFFNFDAYLCHWANSCMGINSKTFRNYTSNSTGCFTTYWRILSYIFTSSKRNSHKLAKNQISCVLDAFWWILWRKIKKYECCITCIFQPSKVTRIGKTTQTI